MNIAERKNQFSLYKSEIQTKDDIRFAEGSGLKLGQKNPLYSKKWNWGAFFLSSIWLACHEQFSFALLVIGLSCIPYVGPIIGLGFAVYLGVNGNNIAYNSRRFTSVDQYVEVQNAWKTWSFSLLAVALLIIFICTLSNPATWFASAHWPHD